MRRALQVPRKYMYAGRWEAHVRKYGGHHPCLRQVQFLQRHRRVYVVIRVVCAARSVSNIRQMTGECLTPPSTQNPVVVGHATAQIPGSWHRGKLTQTHGMGNDAQCYDLPIGAIRPSSIPPSSEDKSQIIPLDDV